MHTLQYLIEMTDVIAEDMLQATNFFHQIVGFFTLSVQQICLGNFINNHLTLAYFRR